MKSNFILLASILIFSNSLFADGLGRLFTTLDQRQELESLRQQQTLEEEITLADEITSFASEIIEEVISTEPLPNVELKGVIYRKNGKRVAWVNETNTLSGDMDAEEIAISNHDIRKDGIRMIPGEGEKPIILNVGERYDGIDRKVEASMDDIVIKHVK